MEVPGKLKKQKWEVMGMSGAAARTGKANRKYKENDIK